MRRLDAYVAGVFSGLVLAAWALTSPRHLRNMADWIEEADQERDLRIALRAIGLYDREKADAPRAATPGP